MTLGVLFAADYFMPINTYSDSRVCGGGEKRYSLIFGGLESFNADKESAIERGKRLDSHPDMTGGCFGIEIGKLLLF